MKANILFKSLAASALLCGCLALCRCNGAPSSSSDSPKENSMETVKPEKEHLCGGFTEQGDLSEEDIALFCKVMNSAEVIERYTPLSVSTQVVAGINYRFYCRYDDGSQEAPAYCNITIYRPLEGEPELTGISPVQ